jgi:hypothetical protein
VRREARKPEGGVRPAHRLLQIHVDGKAEESIENGAAFSAARRIAKNLGGIIGKQIDAVFLQRGPETAPVAGQSREGGIRLVGAAGFTGEDGLGA